MKSLIPYLGLLLLLQLYSCASQTDSVTLEKITKNKKGRALLDQDSLSYKEVEDDLGEEEKQIVKTPETTKTKDVPTPSSGAGKAKMML